MSDQRRTLAQRGIHARYSNNTKPDENKYISLGRFITLHTPAKTKETPTERYGTNLTDLRQDYNQVLRQQPSLDHHVLNSFIGEQKCEKALAVLQEGVGQDLTTTGPQTSPAFLHGLMAELVKLKVIHALTEEVKRTPAHVQNSLIESYLKAHLEDKNIAVSDAALTNLVEVARKDQTPWQTPVAHDTGETVAPAGDAVSSDPV